MSNTINDAITALRELKRLHQLNFELMEQLNIICQWLIDNNIEIPNKEHLRSLLEKSLTLLNEIQADEPRILQYSIDSRRKVTDFRTDEEVTEC